MYAEPEPLNVTFWPFLSGTINTLLPFDIAEKTPTLLIDTVDPDETENLHQQSCVAVQPEVISWILWAVSIPLKPPSFLVSTQLPKKYYINH